MRAATDSTFGPRMDAVCQFIKVHRVLPCGNQSDLSASPQVFPCDVLGSNESVRRNPFGVKANLKAVGIVLLESLILAQDERWRRA